MADKPYYKSLLKEPLLHFVGIGILIFVFYSFLNKTEDSESSYDIVVDQSDIDRLIAAYELNWSQKPDSVVLAKLIDQEIKSEIFAREAKRLDLHHNDEIIKRRLVQKYEFLISDVAEGAQPSENELEDHYQKHLEKYQSLPVYSFYHFYFKEKPDQVAKDALQLTTLNKKGMLSDLQKIGHPDALHIPPFQAAQSLKAIELKLGKAFAEELKTHQSEGWINEPILSGFGFHMVYITKFEASKTLSIHEVRGKVLENWRAEKGQNFKEQLYLSLKDKYNVKVDSK